MPAVAWAALPWESYAIPVARRLYVAGSVYFSGSLYALALTEIRGVGAITPIDGGAFALGWLLLARGALTGR